MVFDVKMEDLRHKARLVAGGHKTKAPATIMYASIVSREAVRIALMLAAINDLEVKLGNILNADVQAPVIEKVWTTLGTEFSKVPESLQGLLEQSQQEQLLGATLPGAWNPWAISLVRLAQIYGLNQKSGQMMGKCTTSIYCVMLMIFYASITMLMPC